MSVLPVVLTDFLHQTSRRQDFEAERPIEIEAIVGAVVELGVAMPATGPSSAGAKMLDQKDSWSA